MALSGIFWVVSLISELNSYDNLLLASGLLSVFFGLPPTFTKALQTIRRCQFDANCMMCLAAIGAIILQQYEEAASVAFLFSISEYLENLASSRARNALNAILALRPNVAYVLHPVTNEMIVVNPAEQVPVGCYVSVRTGDTVVADGVVIQGKTSIDQSSLTGESVPVNVAVGDMVSGGSINCGNGQIVIQTIARVEDSAVCRLLSLVEDAQLEKSPTETLIDSFAKSYTPFVLGLSILLSTIPWILFGVESGKYWTYNGLILIVIACPCALTISTPITYAAALAATAQRGIIVKSGATLETIGSISSVVLDKTGTITEGQFCVANLLTTKTYTRQEVLTLLLIMEAPSSHPISVALVNAAKAEGIHTAPPEYSSVRDHTVLDGEGVTALVNDTRVYVGNQRLFERLGMYHHLSPDERHRIQQWESTDGATIGFVGIDNVGIMGYYSLTDTIRPEATATIASLQQLYGTTNVHMLTGDNMGAAQAVGTAVGLCSSTIHAKLLPEDKLSFVRNLQHEQQRYYDDDDNALLRLEPNRWKRFVAILCRISQWIRMKVSSSDVL